MPHLRLRLALSLDTYDIPEIVRPLGPLFHRWVPDGRNDAINLTTENEPDQLSVWFNRRAANVNGFLQWKRDGTQFDTSIMQRQAKLDGGVLQGEILLKNVTEEEIDAVTSRRIRLNEPFGQEAIDSAPYVALAKRIVLFAQPRLYRFIETLRSQYGQYWLRQLDAWDSRKQSLGSYCSDLGLCWWDELQAEHFRFVPTNSSVMVTMQRRPGRSDAEYLTEQDWRRLQTSHCLVDPSLELHHLGQATRSLDNGHFRQAYVEAVTALELAISRRFRADSQTPETKAALQSAIDKTSLKAQAAIIMRAIGIEVDVVEEVLDAIEIRNAVVHEGYRVAWDNLSPVRTLMRETAKLLGLEDLKTPVLYAGNSLAAPDGSHVELVSSPEEEIRDA